MANLIVPDEVILQLVDANDDCARVPFVLFRVHVRAIRKNDFFLQPFATDEYGIATISKKEILAEVAAHYDSGLMDYSSFEECNPRVEVAPLTPAEIKNALDSRTRVWTTLLRGESERWRDVEELKELYRTSRNGQITAEPVEQSWDGTLERITSTIVIEVR